ARELRVEVELDRRAWRPDLVVVNAALRGEDAGDLAGAAGEADLVADTEMRVALREAAPDHHLERARRGHDALDELDVVDRGRLVIEAADGGRLLVAAEVDRREEHVRDQL